MAEQFIVKVLSESDIPMLMHVPDDVFDNPVDEKLVREFLEDPRHHIVVALSNEAVIGFASAVHYLHPDKLPELWINEVGVASSHQKQGVAKAILKELLHLGRRLGCKSAWVLTDRSNEPANRLYKSAGGQIDPGEIVMYEFDLTDE